MPLTCTIICDLRRVRHLARHAQGRQGVGLAGGAVVDAHLDAQRLIRVVADAADGPVGLREGQVLQLADARRERRQAGGAQVHEGVQPRVRIAHHVVAQGRVVAPPGAAGVHRGGDARRQAGDVRVHRAGPAAVVEMAVDVQEARRHQVASHVDHLGRLGDRNVGLDGGHPAAAEGDVAALPHVLGGIENIAVLEEQVVRLSHNRSPNLKSPG